MKVQTLLHCLKFVSHAQAVKDVRFYLNGVLFEFGEGSLHLAATCSHRLATLRLDYLGPVRGQFIAATADVETLLTVLKASKTGVVNFTDEGRSLTVSAGATGFTFKGLDGLFPDWRRAIPAAAAPALDLPGAHGLNGTYLADASAAFAALGKELVPSTKSSDRWGARAVRIKTHGVNAAVISFAGADLPGVSDVCAVVMPTKV